MDPVTIALIMGGIGALQGQEQQIAAKRQNEINAAAMRYSPWTGVKPDLTSQSGSIGAGVMQGALSGYMLGQNQQTADAQNRLLGAQTNYYNKQAGPATDTYPALPGLQRPGMIANQSTSAAPQPTIIPVDRWGAKYASAPQNRSYSYDFTQNSTPASSWGY